MVFDFVEYLYTYVPKRIGIRRLIHCLGYIPIRIYVYGQFFCISLFHACTYLYLLW